MKQEDCTKAERKTYDVGKSEGVARVEGATLEGTRVSQIGE